MLRVAILIALQDAGSRIGNLGKPSSVTDRWGRGVYWQWICWLPRANRQAKPVSHDVNFGPRVPAMP